MSTWKFVAMFVVVGLAGCARTPGPMAEEKSQMRVFVDEMCTCHDAHCAQRVDDEIIRWSNERSKAATPGGRPTEEDMTEMEAMTKKLTGCKQHAMGIVEVPAPPEPLEDPPSVQECQWYASEIQKVMSCDTLPEATRDTLIESYQQTARAWRNVPAEGRSSLATACTAAAKAVAQVNKTCH